MDNFTKMYESLTESVKTVKIVSRGKGETKFWQLMTPDGSELIDMEFSSPVEAKKYAKKKGFTLKEGIKKGINALHEAKTSYKAGDVIKLDSGKKVTLRKRADRHGFERWETESGGFFSPDDEGRPKPLKEAAGDAKGNSGIKSAFVKSLKSVQKLVKKYYGETSSSGIGYLMDDTNLTVDHLLQEWADVDLTEGINTPRKAPKYAGKSFFTWAEINDALMVKGYSPAKIADILSTLMKAKQTAQAAKHPLKNVVRSARTY